MLTKKKCRLPRTKFALVHIHTFALRTGGVQAVWSTFSGNQSSSGTTLLDGTGMRATGNQMFVLSYKQIIPASSIS